MVRPSSSTMQQEPNIHFLFKATPALFLPQQALTKKNMRDLVGSLVAGHGKLSQRYSGGSRWGGPDVHPSFVPFPEPTTGFQGGV